MIEGFPWSWLGKVFERIVERAPELSPDKRAEVFAQILVPSFIAAIAVCALLQLPPFPGPATHIAILPIKARVHAGAVQSAEGFAVIIEPTVEKGYTQISATWQDRPSSELVSSLPKDVLRANFSKISITEYGLELRLPFTGSSEPYLLAGNERLDSEMMIDAERVDGRALRPRLSKFTSLAVLSLLASCFGTGLYFPR